MPTLTSPTSFADTFTRLMHSPSSTNSHSQQEDTSDLLRSIRAALDRTTSEPTPVHSSSSILSTSTSSSSTNSQALAYAQGLHETLSWDSSRVALSHGGSISRQWSFDREGQPVQWACRAWLDGGITLHTDTRRTEDGYEDGEEERRLRTFGPFSRARARGSVDGGMGGGGGGGKERDRALIVFLRSIGHAYSDEGTPYTFSLPFTVRRAFALYPTGILLQRALEPSESHEEEDEEDMLPTVFSLKSVRQEMSVVGGWSVPRRGVVLDVVERNKEKDVPVLVVLDPEFLKIFICVYREASSPQPSTAPADKKRKSTARRSSLGGADRHTSTTTPSLPIPIPSAPAPAPNPNPSLAALPNMPPSLAPSLTLASLVALPTSGPPPTNSAHFPPAFPSSEQRLGHGHARNESTGLSAGVGRLALDTDVFGGGPHNALNLNLNTAPSLFPDAAPNDTGAGINARRASPMPGPAPVPAREHTKMKATHELVKVGEFAVDSEDAKDPDAIQIAVFDARHDGVRERSLLAVCLPRSHKLSIFSISQSPSTSKEKEKAKEWTAEHVVDLRASSCAAVKATREGVMDLLYTVPPEDRTEGEGDGCGEMVLLTHGLSKIRLSISGERVHILNSDPSPSPDETNLNPMDIDSDNRDAHRKRAGWRILSSSPSSAHVVLVDPHGHKKSVCLDYTTRDVLVTQCLMVLALSLPPAPFFTLHHSFLYLWDEAKRAPDRAYGCFEEVLSAFFGLGVSEEAVLKEEGEGGENAWTRLARSGARNRFKEDDVLRNLSQPPLARRPSHPQAHPQSITQLPPDRATLRAPALHALHHLAEDLRLLVPRAPDLARLAPLIVRLARRVRPEWGEYWVRIVPSAAEGEWNEVGSGETDTDTDDRLPIWPPDLMSGMLARLSSTTSSPTTSATSSTSASSTSTLPTSTSSKGKWYDASRLSSPFASSSSQSQAQVQVQPSFAFGRVEPLGALRALSAVFRALCETSHSPAPQPLSASIPQSTSVSSSFAEDEDDLDEIGIAGSEGGGGNGVGDENVRAAHAAIRVLVRMRLGREFVERLRVPVACVVREAARTCQLAPPPDWPSTAYELVGRQDLAEGARKVGSDVDALDGDAGGEGAGYRGVKDFLGNPHRPSISTLINEAHALATDEVAAGSGVELGPGMADFAQIRFGQDKRLEEVARMLRSSAVCTVKMAERPDLSEMDTAKEQQATVLRIAERTLALPLGRAMFTFGTVPAVSREAYSIPRLEFGVQLVPPGLTLAPEAGKLPPESISWGEFHNGVAAALRLAPRARAVDSSWIKFNRPSELTPSHAGFLYGLGLTGHLRGLLTWHTFAYLTPKHELTSIGVLLGLSAAHAGTGDKHVTKLLAVHTPALLPAPGTDLNVPLATQAAGLVGIGLLFLGARHRRMADVCLRQLARADTFPPDAGSDAREAYTMAAALSFGMVMLGRGSVPPGPADAALVEELRVLAMSAPTAPAASVALGLMYLRTNATEIADALSVPDTVLALNRIQPTLLLLRTLARGLILWDAITPSQEWLRAQVPQAILDAVDGQEQADDALELAYYNIVPAACFVVGLKYAGTAREEPYGLLVHYYDVFSRLAYTNGPAYDQKVKRHAIRDGLNLISVALAMVMAGTGEINVLRRLRYAYGLHNQFVRYGAHVATHQSLGLLFLGGGRATLGSSDASIACMLAAFFPRAAQSSADNKSYLQALRHLWVLAVEPRCLVARDVDTREIVYLPVKIKVRDGTGAAAAQLVSPSLVPDIDRLLSVRVDTPRYWPFYLDLARVPRHRAALLRTQTVFVKRRTAFLSYREDPKGSRSLFVRSGSSTGDAATLDFPRLGATAQPANDLAQFIGSFANEPVFLAFADHLCRVGDAADATDGERLFGAYCHAALLDAILQDKPQALQTHVLLFRARNAGRRPGGAYFNQDMQDLRLAADFYTRTFARRFGNRAPLVRAATLHGALAALDASLVPLQATPDFRRALAKYARGDPSGGGTLGWYLLRNSVPAAALLGVLRELAVHAARDCRTRAPPEGAGPGGEAALDRGIAAVLHVSGALMAGGQGAGWSVGSLREIVDIWGLGADEEGAGTDMVVEE